MINRLLAAAAMAIFASAHAAAQDPENTLILELEDGPVTIELLPEVAPNHVDRIKSLTRDGFYDGVVFHRVIPGFMAQTGDPTGTGAGGSDLPDLKQEFNATKHERGVVSMARTSDPNSANSQFFIMFDKTPSLDNQYTVFGRVIDGMETIDGLNAGTMQNNGAVANPDKIVKARIASDS
ncbi:peptidylprolyl isomerase [Acuticoccus sp. MNP-M23]|uniref:peptidylprolyl isomerase n=1 Tax=Acuticoccus sp. MNP-M23 TaxID=3072793 RepID=UPI0028167CBE|nr:peptidylprolyl isomerase [Acuticoccus sp. MNP-M23]WMS40981.1 peptidylprolyl isomerase [Acuticoccus sp. MNP-M23]